MSRIATELGISPVKSPLSTEYFIVGIDLEDLTISSGNQTFHLQVLLSFPMGAVLGVPHLLLLLSFVSLTRLSCSQYVGLT